MSEIFESSFSKRIELKDQNIIYSNESEYIGFSITVGIPTFKRGVTLERALKSLSKQTFKKFRVIISDNYGASKETLEVTKKFHKKISSLYLIAQEKNIGSIGNFSFLLSCSNTKYFMWLADDDEISENYIETLYKILENNPDTLNKFFISILICFVILIFDGFFQFIFKKNIFGFEMHDNRLSSFFKDELIYGSYLSKFFPIFLSLFFIYKKKNIQLNIIFSIILILSTFAITISGERAALFLIVLTLSYLLIMLKLNYKILIIFFVIISLGISSIVTLNNSIKDRMINFTKNQIISKDKIYFFSKDHTGHYYAAIDIYKENNKIIGIGPKNFRNYCYNNQKYQNSPFICSSHPHNTYIQILTETGILGFLIFLAIFFFINLFILETFLF